MIQQAHPLPSKPDIAVEATTHFDVLWGKPLFRAPDISTRVSVPASVPFTTPRDSDPRGAARQR